MPKAGVIFLGYLLYFKPITDIIEVTRAQLKISVQQHASVIKEVVFVIVGKAWLADVLTP